MTHMDARDALTVALVKARELGIQIQEWRFDRLIKDSPLADRIAQVRADLRALEARLGDIEAQARGERP